MTHLYQLVYKSKRKTNCDEREIQKILASCEKNNPSRNITGILLHSDDIFIQYLEGDKDIIKLYDAIKDDSRHQSPVLLSYGPLKERIFPSWHMGYKKLSKDKINFLTQANSNDKNTFESILNGEQQTGVNAINLLQKFFHQA